MRQGWHRVLGGLAATRWLANIGRRHAGCCRGAFLNAQRFDDGRLVGCILALQEHLVRWPAMLPGSAHCVETWSRSGSRWARTWPTAAGCWCGWAVAATALVVLTNAVWRQQTYARKRNGSAGMKQSPARKEVRLKVAALMPDHKRVCSSSMPPSRVEGRMRSSLRCHACSRRAKVHLAASRAIASCDWSLVVTLVCNGVYT